MEPEQIPETLDLAVMDVSFISIRLVLPAVRELLRPDGDPVPFTMGPLRDGEGTPVEAARHPRMEIRTRLPVRVKKNFC